MNPGFQYLLNRNIDANDMQKWEIGYCGEDGLSSYTFPDDAYKAIVPKFKNSILIPVRDMYGEGLGLYARLLNPIGEQTKHNGTIWKKSEHLFGLDKAWKSMLELGYCYLVEGQFDCIACVKFGYTNTVAIGGTAFSYEHACLLSRFVTKVFVVLDNDSAGQNATIKVINKLKEFNIQGIMVALEKDPDEMLRINPDCLKIENFETSIIRNL